MFMRVPAASRVPGDLLETQNALASSRTINSFGQEIKDGVNVQRGPTNVIEHHSWFAEGS